MYTFKGQTKKYSIFPSQYWFLQSIRTNLTIQYFRQMQTLTFNQPLILRLYFQMAMIHKLLYLAVKYHVTCFYLL